MNEHEIKYNFNGVSVITQRDIGQDCGIVEIPHLGLKVNGAWDWGQHNPRKPGVVGILIGAIQVLGAHFNEHVMEGEPSNYYLGVQAIHNILHREVLGLTALKSRDINQAVLHTVVMYNNREYEVTRVAEFDVTQWMGGKHIRVSTRTSWKAHQDVEEMGISTTLRDEAIVPYFQNRTTKELVQDYITRYGVAK